MSASWKPIEDIVALTPVIPVLVLEDADTALMVGEALLEGGLPVLAHASRAGVHPRAFKVERRGDRRRHRAFARAVEGFVRCGRELRGFAGCYA